MPGNGVPNDVLGVLASLQYQDVLEPNDPRRVDTRAARGSEQTLRMMARKFGLVLEPRRFVSLRTPPVLLFGHVGSGKSTELRYYAQEMKASGHIFPIEVNVARTLDIHNLQFADIVLAMAEALVAALTTAKISPPVTVTQKIEQWFGQTFKTQVNDQTLTADISAGASGEFGLPWLTKIFAKVSTGFKTNATWKEEFRLVTRNNFTNLANAFDDLIAWSEQELARRSGVDPVRILFVIDGTDKLRNEDAQRLFVQDCELLLTVNALTVFTAPIALKYDGGLSRLDCDLVLPMIMLQDRDGNRFDPGWDAMRDILLRRANRALFADDAVIDRLIAACGGHPRDLLRLLQFCAEIADTVFDQAVADKAIERLASDYRRQLKPDDYARLVAIDRAPSDDGNDAQTCSLLYRTCLLEYNNGSWRRSHPAIRTLHGYASADQAPPA
jgi:hypothetical protein